MNYSTLLKALLVAPSISVFLLGNIASAQTQKSCANLDTFVSKTTDRMINQESKFQKHYDEKFLKVADREKKQDEKLSGIRLKQDDTRDARYTKLDERAETDAQKQAVANFKAAMASAIEVRRAAVDKAITDFRAGLKSAIDSRKSSTDGIIAVFKSSVTAALDKAKADCTGGTDVKTVRQTLKADLKTAREKFVSDRKAIDKLKVSAEQLLVTRKTAFEKAMADFKVAAEKARADLKAALKQNGNGNATSTATSTE